jgi:FkbM family methyltransferase
MTAAELLAHARARRVVPNRLARPVFWRLAIRNPASLNNVSVEALVKFGTPREFRPRLDLGSRQGWLMLFQGFDGSGERDMIACFTERASRRLRDRRGRRGGCVIDVGVNHGLYLYHAVAHCPPGTAILGIEANPALVERVNADLQRNGVGPLVELLALTDADGPVELHVGSDDMVSSLRADHVARYGGGVAKVTVPGISLDSLVAERGLRPDLVKVDVEGHERAVLAGAERTLAERRPTLLIEVTPETFADVDARLRAASYAGRLFTGDGLRPADARAVATSGYSNLLYEPRAG